MNPLIEEELKKRLPPLYSQEHVEDPMVQCKFFHPLANMTWYAIEGSEEGDDFIFFGWVYSDFPEPGYFSLNEMTNVEVMGIGMEWDLHFKPKKLSEVKKEHGVR